MQHALVTGASRGIGRAIAVALSARGDRVAVHYGQDRDAAEQTLALLHGDGHTVVGGDLSVPDAAERVVDEVLDAFGRIDVLVNNAALAPSVSTSHRSTASTTPPGTASGSRWSTSTCALPRT